MQNAIEISGLTKTFPQFRLGPVNLTIPRGAIYGFVGPNGAGKTTTLDLLLGMGSPDAGNIRVDGMDHIMDEVAVKQRIGYVSPDLNFQVWGKVGNAIQFVKGFHPTWDSRYCDHLLNIFHINAHDKIATLSFGSRIKLALVLALSWRPSILILDEPTVGLDAVARHELFNELLQAVGQEERTVVISSHALADVERIADHLGFIKDGQILLEGETAELLERYRLVDCQLNNPDRIKQEAGVILARQDGQRCRVLVNRGEDSGHWLQGFGAQSVTTTPVTLEELFVTLSKA